MNDFFKSIGSKFTLTKLAAVIVSAYVIPVLTDWSKEQLQLNDIVQPKEEDNGVSPVVEGG